MHSDIVTTFDQGRLQCVPYEGMNIVQIPVKATGSSPKVACPATMMLHACSFYDADLPLSRYVTVFF